MLTTTTRSTRFTSLFPQEPAFRLRQMEHALFDPTNKCWEDVTTLSAAMRSVLAEHIPWMSCVQERLLGSSHGDTYKVVLRTEDELFFESVLMENKKGDWTICVSCQIGCAMGCTFCATGAMGFTRNLTADEITDQYRFWQQWLCHGEAARTMTKRDHEPKNNPDRISNIVFMGMGEPLANVENVKEAIEVWLRETDLGPVRITVSSVGVLPSLEKILTDPDWPAVRIAISLHHYDTKMRKEIVPTTAPDFHEKLANWTHRYAALKGNRRHHITFEYTLIQNVNDTPEDAASLAKFIQSTAAVKVNVIPLNPVQGKQFTSSERERIDAFKNVLRHNKIDVTERRTMGEDIAAACGQLAIAIKKKSGEVVG